jgi:ribosomal protein S18 acetylase RimI-like enzyme
MHVGGFEVGKLKVIRVTSDNIQSIVHLFDEYRKFYGRPSNPEEGRLFLIERLNKDESVILLALDGEEAVGFVQLYPSFSSEWVKRLWILNDLFVVPQARRRGVGQMLLEESRQLARETGARGLILETGKDNGAAQRLYEKAGWKRDELLYRYYVDI